ncbi:hypothetical protein N0V88_003432 [Collariella sp. IMI 366227]|nr:hypothetical protein N0V88_003432 [Collariella sp. IMI 366227]
MSGTAIESSMSFDPYATSFDASQLQTYSDFSPISVFDQVEDFGTDFTSDSAASPLSPLSPALSASSFGFPTTDAWTSWDSAELSPEPENLFACPNYNSCPPSSNGPLSPVINPMDLAVSPHNNQAIMFQSPQVMLATIPTQQQQQQQLPVPLQTPSAPMPANDSAAKRYPSRAIKRKSTSDSSDGEPPAKSATVAPHLPTQAAALPKENAALGPKKTAHNMIEKRYRTNLNDKITQLRDAVPSLRIMAQRTKMLEGTGACQQEYDDGDDNLIETGLGGLAHGAKLNKATILSKATEYILQLERRNHGLETENSALRGRMEGLEMMLMSRPNVAGVWN